VATLDNAAEELVVKLKGLDSEIEESQHTLEELRGRVDETSDEVEQEWSHLTEAVTSFLDKLRQQQDQLSAEVREALQATADASGAVQEDGAHMRSEIGEAQADMEALSQHATGLEPGVDALAAEAGEAPAQRLAERAKGVEQQLAQVLEEVRNFIQDEVETALDQIAEDVRERCQALRDTFAEDAPAGLQAVFDDWEAKLDELEDYVSQQGFLASHSHARAVVDWALEECRTVCEEHLEALNGVVQEAVRPLQELAEEIQLTGETLTGDGAELTREMDAARASVARAISGLDSVKELLAGYTFVGS